MTQRNKPVINNLSTGVNHQRDLGSRAGVFKEIQSEIQALMNIIKDINADIELFEIGDNIVADVEYLSPEQHGGIYGTVYRQYFNTTLPTSLTSGDNVAVLVAQRIYAVAGGVRYDMRGWSNSGTDVVYVVLLWASGNGNLFLYAAGVFAGGVINGWVDYVKA